MIQDKAIWHSYATVVLIGTLALLGGCSDSSEQGQAQSDRDRDTATMAAIKAANKTSSSNISTKPRQNRGVVKSVESAAGYSYVEVDVLGDVFWLATMVTALQPGEKISWQDYALMTGFRSKALNREFDQILFVDRIHKDSGMTTAAHTGIVEESMNAAGYSFIRVDENGSSIWLAAPETSIEAGQSIRWSGGAAMQNFTSRSLNRVFDEIIFVGEVHVS